MKNKGLFLVLVLSMVLITCNKEEMPEPLPPPPPPPPPRETIVEGRLINHITQIPLEDEIVVLFESIFSNFSRDTTSVNGEFIFHHSESKYKNQDLLLMYFGPYDREKTVINGELNNALPSSGILGLKLKKGEHHSLLIEFTPFE